MIAQLFGETVPIFNMLSLNVLVSVLKFEMTCFFWSISGCSIWSEHDFNESSSCHNKVDNDEAQVLEEETFSHN